MQPLISQSSPQNILNLTLLGDRQEFSILKPVGQQVSRGAADAFSYPDIPVSIVEAAVEKDVYPLPEPRDREGYNGEHHYNWWASGLRDYFAIREAAGLDLASEQPSLSVLELGCASGRVLRHFAIHGAFQCWAADLNLRHVEWVRMFLPETIKVVHNTMLPNLPIPDASLDICCAFSVFTHIDYFEGAWIAELARVLKPGGIAYLTVQTELTWNSLKAGNAVYDELMGNRENIKDYEICPELFLGPMPRDKVVFSWPYTQNYNCNVFCRRSYIGNYWGRFLKVIKFVDVAHGYQDVVILRKV